MLRRFLAALSLVLACGVAQAADDKSFQWVDDPAAGTLDLKYGDAHVVRYMYGFDQSTPERAFATSKPFHHVFGPGSDQLITNGADGAHYPHHRGLYVGWAVTKFGDTVNDFWHCRFGEVQKHIRFVEQTADGDSASMTAEIQWISREGQPVINEQRTVKVSPIADESPAGHGWQIDWSTVIKGASGDVLLNGDRQHAGFQFRAAQPVAEAESARYVRPEGFPEDPKAFEVDDSGDPPRHINLGWLAMTYEIAGQPYTIQYFEDPSLPKPSLFSERPYGRFGAFFKTRVSPEKPLTMRYRILVTASSPPPRDAIQQNYAKFTEELGARESE